MRFTVLLGSIVLVLVLGASPGDGTPGGSSYAGLSSPAPVAGVAATVTYLEAARVRDGHVAAWVGVGGPGMGPRRVDEWMQVGVNDLESAPATAIYFEVVRGERHWYGVVVRGVKAGDRHRFAVLEDVSRRGWWRAWVDGAPVGPAVFLPGSDGEWPAQLVVEDWRAESATCNTFAFAFTEISMRAPHETGKTALTAPVRFGNAVALSRSSPGFRASHRCP